MSIFYQDLCLNKFVKGIYYKTESEEIETTFNLTALGTGNAIRFDNETVKTDCYCRLITNSEAITEDNG